MTMVVLGFNEFVAVLRNPCLLLFLVIVFLFGKTVWAELDVEGELQRGLLPGAMALSGKLVPTLKSSHARTLQAGRPSRGRGGGGGSRPGSRPGNARGPEQQGTCVNFDDEYEATSSGIEALRQRRVGGGGSGDGERAAGGG